MVSQVGFGGSCHWCTEAVFQSLKGVLHVEQGWISSSERHLSFSEGVIVHFQPDAIALEVLIAIHLHTHSCTSKHSMRSKYRSAIYTFTDPQAQLSRQALANLQHEFRDEILTQVIPFQNFKLNQKRYLNYYYSNPDKPFCKNIVNPKLRLLLEQFSSAVDHGRLPAARLLEG